MNRPLFALLMAAAVAGLPPSASSAEGDDGEVVIATVDGMAVTAADFDRACQGVLRDEDQDLAAYRDEVVEQLVLDTLLYQEALRQQLDRDPKVRKLVVNLLLRRDVYGQVSNDEFGEEEMRAYWAAHAPEFVVPEKVQVKRILIRPDDANNVGQARALAQRLRADVLRDPSRFKELAVEHSACPYARRGGDLGFLSREGKPGLDPRVVEAAFALAVGEVGEVLELDGEFHVLLLANRREQVERSFEQMRGSVLRRMKSERYLELYELFAADLRDGARIEVDADAVDQLVPRPPSPGPPAITPYTLPAEDTP